jgi:hypothetical protein
VARSRKSPWTRSAAWHSKNCRVEQPLFKTQPRDTRSPEFVSNHSHSVSPASELTRDGRDAPQGCPPQASRRRAQPLKLRPPHCPPQPRRPPPPRSTRAATQIPHPPSLAMKTPPRCRIIAVARWKCIFPRCCFGVSDNTIIYLTMFLSFQELLCYAASNRSCKLVLAVFCSRQR